jgi:ribonuclease VapC
VIVLDASAFLALLHREAGWEVVARAVAVDSATVSAVNYAEVLQKAAQHAIAPEVVDAAVEGLGLTVSPFGRLDARLAASSTGTARG